MDDGTLFDETPANAAKKKPLALDAELAKAYRDAARLVAMEGEEALAKRLKPGKDDPRLLECRAFLQALSAARGDQMPILFYAVMREAVAAAHSGRGRNRFPQQLFGSMTNFESAGMHGDRNAFGKPFTVTPGKQGDFPMLPMIVGRLRVLNALGYDIHVVGNRMLFNHRCKMACPWIHILVLELDDATMAEQERLLDAIRPMVAAAVFSGKKSVHLFVPLARPIRNTRCVRASNWLEFRDLKRSGGLAGATDVPAVERAAEALRVIVVNASGKEPDIRVLKNFATLTRAPGFRHGETGGMSRLLHADPEARWDGVSPMATVIGDKGSDNQGRAAPATCGEASPLGHGDNGSDKDGTKACGGDGPGLTTSEALRERVKPSFLRPPSRPLPDPVLNNDVMEFSVAAPKRTFLDDLDDFARLLSEGLPGRRQRLKMHSVLMNAARILGWLPGKGASDGAWAKAKERLLGTWRGILLRTPIGHTAMGVDAAIEDFGRHIDASVARGTLATFRPKLPDFKTLPAFDAPRSTAWRTARQIVALIEAGVLPAPEGDARMRSHMMAGASRITVEELCRLARIVPNKCRSGEAAIPAVRMQSLCPSRRYYKEVLAWLVAANILRATHPYILPSPGTGRGRPRLYFVNLPLVVWLAGVRKHDLSWAAPKASSAPRVASEAPGEGRTHPSGIWTFLRAFGGIEPSAVEWNLGAPARLATSASCPYDTFQLVHAVARE